MKRTLLLFLVATLAIPFAAPAQETPPTMVTAYDTLAKVILEVRQAEEDYVRAMLAGHFHGAEAYAKKGMAEMAAAEMALFANEGDNAVAGVRKRLVEGGHHHNAAGEEAGIYDEGYVIVTREAKQAMLAASKAMREAADEAGRDDAWAAFTKVAKPLLGS